MSIKLFSTELFNFFNKKTSGSAAGGTQLSCDKTRALAKLGKTQVTTKNYSSQ
jgi:hypothetical protein